VSIGNIRANHSSVVVAAWNTFRTTEFWVRNPNHSIAKAPTGKSRIGALFFGWQLAVGRLPLAVPKRNSGVMRVLCLINGSGDNRLEARIAKPSTADGQLPTANGKRQTVTA
jgi:hypothetical protein